MKTTREHQDFPTRELDTPFGRMRIVVTGFNHVYLKPLSNGYKMRVNRVNMYVSMHLRNYGDGQGFVPDQGEGKTEMAWNSVYARREGNVDVSMAAQEKVIATLPNVANKWLEGQGEILKESRQVELNNDILRKEEALKEAEENVADLHKEVRQLQEMEAKL